MTKMKTIGLAIVFGSIACSFFALSSCTKSGVPSCEDGNVRSGVLNAFFDKFKDRYADMEIARNVYHTDLVNAEMRKLGGKLQPNPECPGYRPGMGFAALKAMLDKDKKATVGAGPDHIVNLIILKDEIDRASTISPGDYNLSGIQTTSKDDAAGKCACTADISLRKTGRNVGAVAYSAEYASKGLRVAITKGSVLDKKGRPEPGFDKLFP